VIAAIIQARWGSTRLRGKVLEDLCGSTVLARVLARARAIDGVDKVCCAVPDGPEDDLVAAAALQEGATVFRGSRDDVLSRYLGAARHLNAHVVVRITSDCPLLDPAVSASVLERFLVEKAEYCSNVAPRTWPRGLDTEVFSRGALERAAVEATTDYDREHVTPWLRNNPELRHAHVVRENVRSYADLRWTLDYQADLAFMRAVFSRLPPEPPTAGFDAILRILEAEPEITALNAHLGV
jgi:spore coat polysaccharide biosynthesis protein SpsF